MDNLSEFINAYQKLLKTSNNVRWYRNATNILENLRDEEMLFFHKQKLELFEKEFDSLIETLNSLNTKDLNEIMELNNIFPLLEENIKNYNIFSDTIEKMKTLQKNL